MRNINTVRGKYRHQSAAEKLRFLVTLLALPNRTCFIKHDVKYYAWFLVIRLLLILITDLLRAENVILFHFYKWYLSFICCFSEHIVTCFTWFVIRLLLCIYRHHSCVYILITNFYRAGSFTGNVIFFNIYECYLLPICCFSEHIVSYYKWFVILRLQRIYSNHFHVCILMNHNFAEWKMSTPNFFFHQIKRGYLVIKVNACAIRPTWKFSYMHDLSSAGAAALADVTCVD